jgi:hypothetical protein
MAYSIWKQLQLKVFKGDWKALQAILLALLDLIWNMPRIVKNANRLTTKEYEAYLRIADTKIYWEQDKKEFT